MSITLLLQFIKKDSFSIRCVYRILNSSEKFFSIMKLSFLCIWNLWRLTLIFLGQTLPFPATQRFKLSFERGKFHSVHLWEWYKINNHANVVICRNIMQKGKSRKDINIHHEDRCEANWQTIYKRIYTSWTPCKRQKFVTTSEAILHSIPRGKRDVPKQGIFRR